MPNATQPISDMLVSRSLSAADYVPTLDAMLARTLERIALKKEQSIRTADELWIVDHNDVYTLGQAGKEEHILRHTDTPIIKTDRGGQVTWHGHGQVVLYWLFDLHSLGWSVRTLVSHAEQAIEDVINDCLQSHALSNTAGIGAHARRDAPGVYLYANTPKTLHDSKSSIRGTDTDDTIMLGKMASLGFKIKQGFSYHGIAINLNCDLSAFNAINPCGYAGMQMLRLSDFVAMQANTEQSNSQQQQSSTHINPQGQDFLSYEQVIQKLLDNIADRHAGRIELRDIEIKENR